MADNNTPNGENVALKADEGVAVPRLQLGEVGFLGLKTINGKILEESQGAFRYPAFIRTVNEMRCNPTVGAAMNVYRMMISRVKWNVVPHVEASESEIARASIVKTMMSDMEHSWPTFIESVIPYLEYGFGINEMILRRRLKKNGSKFSDGLVGLKKLAPRSQDTISKWIFSDDGSDLLSVQQSIAHVENSYRYMGRTNENGLIDIPRKKFLLFSASSSKGNPEGQSLYKNIYLAYKQLSLIQENELVGLAKDIQGILKIGIPPDYLSADASADKKASAASFQQIIDNYNAGTQRGLLVPLLYDPETKQPIFSYDLMEAKGTAKYPVEDIIKRLQGDILSALSVDILKLGADGTGSFSLAESKSSVLAIAIDYRLREIAEVLNSQLMRTIYEQNGWDTEKMPSFVYEDIEEINIDDFSSAIQRIFATSAIEVDREILNRVRKVLGVSELPKDLPVQEDKLPAKLTGQATSSGEGMKNGSGDGTRKNAISGKGDNSVANKANAP